MTRPGIYRVTAAGLLCLAGGYRYHTMKKPADVTDYQAAIRASVARVPSQFEGWIGEDCPVPVQATMLLQPDVMISKLYRNVETGRSVNFLLVHCADAHDMAGHFPKRCYPASNWHLDAQQSRDWRAGDLVVPGTEYNFSLPAAVGSLRGGRSITVANFLLRPGGHVLRDMDEMLALIRGAGGEALGAAQVQVVFEGSGWSQAERDRTVQAFIGGYRPVIDAILATPAQAAKCDGPRQARGRGAR